MVRDDYKKIIIGARKIAETEMSSVYKLADGNVFKQLSMQSLLIHHTCGLDFQGKLEYADNLKNIKELYSPASIVVSDNLCVGYTTLFNTGVNYRKYITSVPASSDNMEFYVNMFRKISEMVRKLNQNGVVIPDLGTSSNLYFDKDGNPSLIDYDGMQVDKHPSICFSTTLGVQRNYYDNPKYFDDKTRLWNPNLDKTTLMIMFFLAVLNADFSKVGMVNPSTGLKVTTDFIYYIIKLFDNDICKMIDATFSNNEDGFYLDEILDIMLDKYELSSQRDIVGIRTLVHK